MRLHLLTFIIASLSLSAQNSKDKTLNQLKEWMCGSFSSQAQSKEDTSYFDIRLEIVPIWEDRTDGLWLYVEQAMASRKDKPYRQRIYQLSKVNSSEYESRVFTFSAPLRFAGKHKELSQSLNPDSLQLRQGCSVYLTLKNKSTFDGKTKGKECNSDLRGARYATSTVILTKDYLLSWDQGFNEADEQVWGATKGGYRFEKIRKR